MALEPGKIRNVAVVGHRGTGKTSLVEAMLFQAGATDRLGTVEAGSTVTDWDEDEQRRQMSLASSIAHCDWHDRRINLVDTPGTPASSATRSQRSASSRARSSSSAASWASRSDGTALAAREEGRLSRVLFVNMLDRERADFFRVLAPFRSS